MAVFTLPPELMPFYKKHLEFIVDKAVNPDKRRYIVPDEAPRHYLDVEFFGDSLLTSRPDWGMAVTVYAEDSMKQHGLLPWNILRLTYRLKEAFENKDTKNILRISADLGHYIGDLHVPLHTTKNYNGQLTGQHGIHGLWESRLPELYASGYSYYVGRAQYVPDLKNRVWDALQESNRCVDSVLAIEKRLQKSFREDKIYAYEDRNGQTVRVYSPEFSGAYHQALDHMVERRMRDAITLLGDCWYTCWVNAGKPDPASFNDLIYSEEELKVMEKEQKLSEGQGCNH